jgi:hypothetical protein
MKIAAAAPVMPIVLQPAAGRFDRRVEWGMKRQPVRPKRQRSGKIQDRVLVWRFSAVSGAMWAR